MGDDELLSAAQVAARLGVDRSHVARLVKLGRLPAQRVGRSYVFRAGDVAAYQPKHGGWPRGRPRKPAPVSERTPAEPAAVVPPDQHVEGDD